MKEPKTIIAIMGVTGVGKSTFIQHATGCDVPVGARLEACTQEVRAYPIPGTPVWLFDTPGFDDTYRNDAAILKEISECLADCFHEGAKISGIIYVHPITDVRMKGSAMKNLRTFRKILGDGNMSNCRLVTTKWSLQDMELSLEREKQLAGNKDFWKPLLALGAQIERFGDSSQSAWNILKPLVLNSGFVPQLTDETERQGKRLGETAAGKEVNEDLEQERKNHRRDIADLRAEHAQAIAERDYEYAEMIKDERKKLEEEMETLKGQQNLLREEHRRREGSTLRWLARGVAAGFSTAMTIASAGSLAPAAAAFYGVVEAVTQIHKHWD